MCISNASGMDGNSFTPPRREVLTDHVRIGPVTGIEVFKSAGQQSTICGRLRALETSEQLPVSYKAGPKPKLMISSFSESLEVDPS